MPSQLFQELMFEIILETAKYEHIPKKKVKIILSIKALFINIFKYSIAILLYYSFDSITSLLSFY